MYIAKIIVFLYNVKDTLALSTIGFHVGIIIVSYGLVHNHRPNKIKLLEMM